MKVLVSILAVTVLTVSLAAQQRAPQFEPIPAPPDVAKPPADAEKTASGLASKVLQPGTGTARPKAEDFVTVHYTGWTTDGKMFDSSHARGAASTFPVTRVIKGWGEGVQLMTSGEKRRLWIPQELAYAGQAGRPQGMLVFDVELVDIVPAPDKNPPPDVAAPPADAQKTPSGLAYKVLRPGAPGGSRPTKQSRVTVHYSGWTTDGKLFDSSLMRGQTASFGLTDVIEGWTEGLQARVQGPGKRSKGHAGLRRRADLASLAERRTPFLEWPAPPSRGTGATLPSIVAMSASASIGCCFGTWRTSPASRGLASRNGSAPDACSSTGPPRRASRGGWPRVTGSSWTRATSGPVPGPGPKRRPSTCCSRTRTCWP
jgi:FKBP-type peptidyl-prolyl cis-trans isomerase